MSAQCLTDMHPAYLYVPECSGVLRLLQLPHEKHPFTGFSHQSFVVVGYIADYHEVTPIYADVTLKEAKPWLNVVKSIGTLVFPDGMGRIEDTHPLFETNAAGGALVRAVKTEFCRSNELGFPCPMWSLSHLLNASIQFNSPQYPDGFPPPVNYHIHENPVALYDAPSAISLTEGPVTNSLDTAPVENMQLISCQDMDYEHTSLHSQDTQSGFLSFALDLGHAGWPVTSNVSISGYGDQVIPDDDNELLDINSSGPDHRDLDMYPELAWRDSTDLWGNLSADDRRKIYRKMPSTIWFQRMRLTKALLLGSLWAGLHGNPFKISAVETRRLITMSFLTSLCIDGKTYAQVIDQPLTWRNGRSIGWPTMRTTMLQAFDNGKAELRKILKAAMTHITNFCRESQDHKRETILAFVKRFNGDIQELQKVICEITRTQAFKELAWAALFIPVDDLISEHDTVRIADLFVEDIRTTSGCLAPDTVCNLMTLLYQSMLLILVEFDGKSSISGFKTHVAMNGVIMFALHAMYDDPICFADFTRAIKELLFITSENVLDIAPKTKAPRHVMVGNEKRGKVLSDLKAINTAPSTQASPSVLPNNGSFQPCRSFSDVSCPVSYFRPATSIARPNAGAPCANLISIQYIPQFSSLNLLPRCRKKFSSDRYLEGVCPHCSHVDARSDQCDGCSRTLDPIVARSSSHIYFKIDAAQPALKDWIKKSWKKGKSSPNATINADGNIVDARMKSGLKPTPVTRDLAWGVPISPLGREDDKEMSGKVLYIWFDAVIGYVSITGEYTPEWI
ncbi:hypothetical protein P692DRAFT_20881067 [Suillus brevipes Sb2]|nr:hypothetical protein P692DRAFT_20881067 [Suillus brevipes Sb2]